MLSITCEFVKHASEFPTLNHLNGSALFSSIFNMNHDESVLNQHRDIYC